MSQVSRIERIRHHLVRFSTRVERFESGLESGLEPVTCTEKTLKLVLHSSP